MADQTFLTCLDRLFPQGLNPAQGIVVGALLTGLITLVTAVVTAGLRTRLERRKWLRRKKESIYRECMNLLYISRRWPINGCLPKKNYEGAMASVYQLPIVLSLAEDYSSRESRSKINFEAEKLSDYIVKQKLLEPNFVNLGDKNPVQIDKDLFPCIETLINIIQICSKRELDSRSLLQKIRDGIIPW
jgi:hypothetical protein